MEYAKAYPTLVSVLIFVFNARCNIQHSSGIRWTKYSADTNRTGYMCNSLYRIFEEKNVSDPIACSKMCDNNHLCRDFAYQPVGHNCVGCRKSNASIEVNYRVLKNAAYFHRRGFDCKDIKAMNPTAKSGIYVLNLQQTESGLEVYCDMDTEHGPATVIHNRFDGSVDFYRNFTEYENGFGDIRGEFWLGLKYIQEIARQGYSLLLLEVTRLNGWYVGKDLFFMSMPSDRKDYRLRLEITSIGILSGNFWHRLYQPFSTMDRDMDLWSGNCAKELHGAGWYTSCGGVNLLGKYCPPGRPCDDGKNGTTGHYHKGIAGLESLKTSRMLLIRRNEKRYFNHY